MCDNRFMKDPRGKEEGSLEPKKDEAKKDDQPKESTGLNLAPTPNPKLAELSAKVNAGIPDDVDKIAADQLPWNNPHWHPAHGGIFRNVVLHVTDPLHIS